jgi:hypothetical protein
VEDDDTRDHQKAANLLMRSEICDERKFHNMVQSDGECSRPRVQFERLRAGYLKDEDTNATCLDSLGRFGIANVHNVIHMIAKCNEKVKEKFTATLHFCLHGSAPLKCLATSDD